MRMFLLYVRTAWNDFFSGTSPTNLPSQTYTSRQNPSNTYVHVSNSLFGPITSTDHGGALYCSSSVTYLLVESTSFFSCKTSGGNGGAIFFSNTNNGQCVLYDLCGYDCCTSDTGWNVQFVYIRVNNGLSSKNYVNYSSISRCVNENAWFTLYLYDGKICCQSINLSMNKCRGQFIYCYPFYDSNSVICSLSYSSFNDNIATYYTCFLLYRTAAKYEIKSCNILRNTQGTLNSEGTIRSDGYLTIDDSCILENKANRNFHQGSSYPITLSNCTVDSTSNNGYLTITNTVTKSFILALNHMSTLNCHSEYDSVGTLNPIIQTPSSSKKQKLCFTYVNCFYQSQQRIFFSLLGVFIFNFIHLDVSYDPFY
jgi:hypothetical protein